MAKMQWFRQIHGARILYLGDDLENERYNALNEDGEKLRVDDDDFNMADEVEVSEAAAVKLWVIWDEFDQVIQDGCVGYMDPKFLEYRWRRVFMKDEVVDSQGFMDNFIEGLEESLEAKVSEMGYRSIKEDDSHGELRRIIFEKEEPMGDVLSGKVFKLKLLGVPEKEMMTSKDVTREITRALDRVMLLKPMLKKYRVSASNSIEFNMSKETVKNLVVVKFEDIPWTRETAREIGRNLYRFKSV